MAVAGRLGCDSFACAVAGGAVDWFFGMADFRATDVSAEHATARSTDMAGSGQRIFCAGEAIGKSGIGAGRGRSRGQGLAGIGVGPAGPEGSLRKGGMGHYQYRVNPG